MDDMQSAYKIVDATFLWPIRILISFFSTALQTKGEKEACETKSCKPQHGTHPWTALTFHHTLPILWGIYSVHVPFIPIVTISAVLNLSKWSMLIN